MAHIRILTYNVDGLSDDIADRLPHLLQNIADSHADVVLLQEVIPQVRAALQTAMPDYVYVDEDPQQPYFVAMLLRRDRFVVRGVHVDAFPSSRMARYLLTVGAQMIPSGQPLIFMTSHLESLQQNRAERQRQLGRVFADMASVPEGTPTLCLFGGDTNLKDVEYRQAMAACAEGNKHLIQDAWNCLGEPGEVQWTWDPRTNPYYPAGRFKAAPKRYDRILLRSDSGWHVESMELAGTSHTGSTNRCASDHYGVVVTVRQS
jgi:endonuclease/exonuclease/phosphatase family metal-dependent hydrolase